MFDLGRIVPASKPDRRICVPNASLKRDGDLCSKNSYCCVICSTMGCHAVDIEKWGFKRTLLRMKLQRNEDRLLSTT
jgi:hypothetical protein